MKSVWVMDHYNVYLKGKHFLLYTDNKPITKLNTVHTITLNGLNKSIKQFDFNILPLQGNKLPANFKSNNLVNMINCDNNKWRKIQNQEPWISQCK